MQSIKAASVYLISNNQMAIMLRKKEKPISVIICKFSDSLLKAVPDTESAFCLSLVIVFSPLYYFIFACMFWSYIYF